MSITIRQPSQAQRILAHLKKGRTLTPLEAIHKFDCLRLSGRILELREAGYLIKSRIVEINGKRVARYLLVN